MTTTACHLFILIGVFIYSFSSFAQCGSSESKDPTVFANDASIGTLAWEDPANASASDNVRSTAGAFIGVLSTVNTNYLIETGFGFSIPADAIICGIQIDVERRRQGILVGSSVKDNSLKIVKGGVITGTEHASVINWPGTDIYQTYGGPADLWGEAWTPADVNDPDFGIAYSSAKINTGLAALFISAEIDHVQMTIFYTSPLPIELLDFSAFCDSDNNIQLNWTAASQTNNDYFTIERTRDGNHFDEVAIIDGAGTTNQVINYSITDESRYDEKSYYRLKQTDFSGSTKSFELISVDCYNNPDLLIFPNPSTGNFTINASGNLRIYNSIGNKVNFDGYVSGTTLIDLSGEPKGIYFYQLETPTQNISGKLIVN